MAGADEYFEFDGDLVVGEALAGLAVLALHEQRQQVLDLPPIFHLSPLGDHLVRHTAHELTGTCVRVQWRCVVRACVRWCDEHY